MPKVERLKTPEATFDFLNFEEADQLVASAEAQWKPMIVTALHSGMRLGELCGLQWDCVDLELGRLFVRRSLYRGNQGTPKSGRSRELPYLSPDVCRDAVKALERDPAGTHTGHMEGQTAE